MSCFLSTLFLCEVSAQDCGLLIKEYESLTNNEDKKQIVLENIKNCIQKKNNPLDTLHLTYYNLKKLVFFKANLLDSVEKYIQYSHNFLKHYKKDGNKAHISEKNMEIKVLKLEFEKAILFHRRKKYVDAIETYQKLLPLFQKHQDNLLESKALHNLATIYTELYQYEGALEYIQKSKEISEKTNDYTSKGKISHQQSEIYFVLKKYPQAEKCIKEAIVYFQKANLVDYAIATKLRQDIILKKQKKTPLFITPKLDIDVVKGFATIIQKGGAGKITKATAILDMATLLIEQKPTNQTPQKECVDLAKDLLEKSDKMCQETNLRINLSGIYLAWVNIYKLENNPQKVFEFYEKYIKIKDEIAIEGSRLQLNGLKIIHDIAQHQQQIETLTQNQKITNLWVWLLTIIVFFVIIITIFLRVIMTQRLKISQNKIFGQNLEIKNQQLEIKNQQLEIQSQQLANEKLEEENMIKSQQNKLLEIENAQKNRELATSTLHIIKNNKVMDKLKTDINPLLYEETLSTEIKKQLQQLKGSIRENEFFETNWQHFKHHFEKIHPHFFDNLKKTYPILTPNDLRHCAYVRMNLSRKEIALLCNVNVEAVKVARNRLKKKLNLGIDDNIHDFLLQIQYTEN